MIALILCSGALAQQPMTSEELEAILTFREQHLSVREVVDFVPGSVNMVNNGWGWGSRPYWGWGWNGRGAVAIDPPELEREWAVFQGPQRLAVPAYLQAIQRPELADELQRRITNANAAGDAFAGLGWIGLLGGVASTVVSFAAPELEFSNELAIGGAASTGAGLLSLIIGGAEQNRARNLTYDFERTQDLLEVQRAVRETNEALRQDLQITPAQAYRELVSD